MGKTLKENFRLAAQAATRSSSLWPSWVLDAHIALLLVKGRVALAAGIPLTYKKAKNRQKANVQNWPFAKISCHPNPPYHEEAPNQANPAGKICRQVNGLRNSSSFRAVSGSAIRISQSLVLGDQVLHSREKPPTYKESKNGENLNLQFRVWAKDLGRISFIGPDAPGFNRIGIEIQGGEGASRQKAPLLLESPKKKKV